MKMTNCHRRDIFLEIFITERCANDFNHFQLKVNIDEIGVTMSPRVYITAGIDG